MAYATSDELAAWLRSTPLPVDADRLLEEASDDIDEVLLTAVYDPEDPDVQEALMGACVRQVHWMMGRGDETGAEDDVQSKTVGQRSVTRRTVGASAGAAQFIGPRVIQVLRAAGLLSNHPQTACDWPGAV